MLTNPAVAPGARIPISFNYADILAEMPGVTITGIAVTIEVHPLSRRSDATPNARLSGAAFLDGSSAVQWFENGLADVNYALTFKATLSQSEVDPVVIIQPVRQFPSG